ncbi:NADP-dependent malic enzyme [uncultured Roseburia sp.]|uniref:NADP-dependent malic enzyme n=1 Tax=Brotonthovivens ammoniilytica TaxID=2981725 RepID=A0ABT2TJE1_9FIRM|nr:NADP-dependent malic enzyme [Brotonthovivens ammoniilytica]MCU6762328.1 NADP-dependent malic enzyme [Brotonthovivens ammoniilytica]SCI68145.1 NADP-dependent malic enzyme [uncultured Roseburia sp.]
MNLKRAALERHYKLKGKIEVVSRAKIESVEDLAVLYTPGVAQPCLEIQKDIRKSFDFTRRNNLVAVITDGTAVLGLGDIGPEAGMPVMEGKCLLFKELGNVDAFPLCIQSRDPETIVETIVQIAGSFGGINLEDISAPRCFEIEEKLKKRLNIPVFHDDQHGTAVVVLAGIINALKLTGKEKHACRVVINGAGSAGIATAKLLHGFGFENIIVCDIRGIIARDDKSLNQAQMEIAGITNHRLRHGSLADALDGADIFVGVSAPGVVTADMIRRMNQGAIVFAMANPVPEIMPDLAKAAGAAVVGTGRSDFPNQINNVLAFPGIFRGALDVGAGEINEEMKLAAALAIADTVSKEELTADHIVPELLDPRVLKNVSKAVREAAIKTGAAGVRKEV